MVRAIFAAVLFLALVSASSAFAEYKKKLFMKYATSNLFVKCMGQEAMDKFVVEYMRAAGKCYNREFDPQLKPVYIKPYPVDGEVSNNRLTSNKLGGYHNYQQQNFNNQPFLPPYAVPQQEQYQHYQQQPQYQQYQQPQYQNQYRQPPFPQQFYAPGFGFQPLRNQVNTNQVHNRKVRQAESNNVENSVVADTNVAGEAELYYYNKLKNHLTPKIGNFSCVMHEMGYFTADNQVDLEKYKQAYEELTLPAAMKEEFIQNIDLCQEVSECLPEKCFQKYPYGPEYGRSFFFVMCEKKKAMEVCLKKQMIDDYYKYKDIFKGEEIPDEFEEHEDLFSMGF